MANERLPREQREGMSKGEVGWTGIGITLGVKGKTSLTSYKL